MRRLAAVAAGLLFMASIASTGMCLASPPSPARASAPACPPGMTCITGKLAIRDPGSDTPHQLLIEDKNGAPMFWVDYGGAWSGGEPVCVTGLHLEVLACLGGPQGSYGGKPVVTLYTRGRGYSLTAADIRFLHKLERKRRV